ncbi:MAG: hypothetical protein V4580_11000 [Bacteroidota bacterium]
MKNKRLIIILSTIAALLFVPLIAMQFTHEVNWTASDFGIMGILLLSTGLLCELILRLVSTKRNRVILCALILVLFLLTYVEMAVGLFGTPFAGS